MARFGREQSGQEDTESLSIERFFAADHPHHLRHEGGLPGREVFLSVGREVFIEHVQVPVEHEQEVLLVDLYCDVSRLRLGHGDQVAVVLVVEVEVVDQLVSDRLRETGAFPFRSQRLEHLSLDSLVPSVADQVDQTDPSMIPRVIEDLGQGTPVVHPEHQLLHQGLETLRTVTHFPGRGIEHFQQECLLALEQVVLHQVGEQQQTLHLAVLQ